MNPMMLAKMLMGGALLGKTGSQEEMMGALANARAQMGGGVVQPSGSQPMANTMPGGMNDQMKRQMLIQMLMRGGMGGM